MILCDCAGGHKGFARGKQFCLVSVSVPVFAWLICGFLTSVQKLFISDSWDFLQYACISNKIYFIKLLQTCPCYSTSLKDKLFWTPYHCSSNLLLCYIHCVYDQGELHELCLDLLLDWFRFLFCSHPSK